MFRPLLLTTVLLFALTTAVAQDSKKPLINADVVTMVKGGLPEDTIVLAIGSSPGKYDTSPEALIALKQHEFGIDAPKEKPKRLTGTL